MTGSMLTIQVRLDRIQRARRAVLLKPRLSSHIVYQVASDCTPTKVGPSGAARTKGTRLRVVTLFVVTLLMMDGSNGKAVVRLSG